MKVGKVYLYTYILCVIFDLHYRKIDFASSVKQSSFVHPRLRKLYPFL